MSGHDIYIVGSVPLANAEEVFTVVSAACSPRLKPSRMVKRANGWIGSRGSSRFSESPALELSDEEFQLHASAPPRRRYRLRPGRSLADFHIDNLFYLVNWFMQDELVEDPKDFIATHLLSWAQGFSVQTEHFYAFYLLSHGVVKLLLIAGLLRNRLWAYPASLVVMGLFIVYQLYRYMQTGGTGLILLTLFDLFVIALSWHEYRLVRRHSPVG